MSAGGLRDTVQPLLEFNGAAFRNGRGFSAWIGIVPGEYSTGGKQKLLGISKRGNPYLRRLFIQGARAVLQQRVNRRRF
jgi:transposase